MKIIIDTHIFLWALSDPDKLPDNWAFELKRSDNRIFLSAISVAEIMIKKSIGKLKFDYDPVQLADEAGFEMLDFTGADAIGLGDLPFHHKDPFDRMLISQSISRGFKLMTMDEKFSAYSCQIL